VDPVCPTPVTKTRLVQRWADLAFLHWEFEPADVQALLPSRLRVDTFDGSAWVGLVPFEMQGVRPPWLPTLGPFGRFAETNVRTYVVGPDGGRGVYFFSLDAAQLAPTVAARTIYRLPYFWSAMAVQRSAQEVTYTTLRRWPGPKAAFSRCSVHWGQAVEATELDVFLTARWGLYEQHGDRVRYTMVDHEPWPLHEVEVTALEDELVAATGLPEPVGRFVARWTPGVGVRIGPSKVLPALGAA
jgi:hypothetical protein